MAEKIESSETDGQKMERNENSVEATIESGVQEGVSSTCNNLNNNAESSTVNPDDDREKSLEYAEELIERGSMAAKEQDYAEAIDCFSRALEIRVGRFGELAPECVHAYYKYGCALLYKAQDEADPLGAVPRKDEVQRDSDKDGSVRSTATVESATTSVRSDVDESGVSNDQGKEKVSSSEAGAEGKEEEEEEEDEEESDGEQLADDEDESDLDLAWKMLDVARVIVENHSGDTMEKVDILSALAEVALEREDVETSLSDYLKALSILERLVEPDSRRIAELNFRICLCLELGSKPEEAISYCQKALSLCKSRVDRLKNEVISGSTKTVTESEQGQTLQQVSSTTESSVSVAQKEAEIETLSSLSIELERKLEDLQQLVANPKSLLSDILEMVSAKARGPERATASVAMSSSQVGTVNSNGGFDSPTVSTAHTSGTAGVTHLGVVGRGVKRVLTTAESSPAKKPATEPSPNNGGSSGS